MTELPGYREGHLLVAAIRLLEARLRRPPDDGELAELLGWPVERVGLVSRGLQSAGVVRAVTHAFDSRLEIVNHLELEKLPRDESQASIVSELAEFGRKSDEEQEKLTHLFESGDPERQARERNRKLDEEFGRFQKKRPPDPFDSQ